MSGPNGTSSWFDDIPPWPASNTTPAHFLADALAAARVAVAGESSSTAATAVIEAPPTRPAPQRPPAPAPRPEPPTPRPADDFLPDYEAEFTPVPAHVPSGAGSDLESFLDSEAKRNRQSHPAPEAGDKKTRGWRGHRGILISSAAAVVLVLGLGTFGLVRLVGGESEVASPNGSTTTMTDAGSSTASGVDCSATQDGPVTTGNDAGDQQSGPAVIKAFNYAYYELRSAAKARAVAAPNAVADEQKMQTFIDQRAIGTHHCLSITDKGNGAYAVTLTEIQPGAGAPIVYNQLIQTTQAGGKYWIASIKSVK